MTDKDKEIDVDQKDFDPKQGPKQEPIKKDEKPKK